jgi:hypothetical protein
MFGFTNPTLPITIEQQRWVDSSCLRLATPLGARRLPEATVVPPNPDHFPDPYDGSESARKGIFERGATTLQVEPSDVAIARFASEDDLTRSVVPFWDSKTSEPAGHDPAGKPHISIDQAQMKEPIALVAALTHELGHTILLRRGLVSRAANDMEPRTDLLTVLPGVRHFHGNRSVSLSTTHGQQVAGLVRSPPRLSLRGTVRLETAWRKFLSTNASSYLKRSAWRADRREPRHFL